MADFNQAIALNPDYAQAFNSLDFTYDMLGRRDEVLQDYQRAYDLGKRAPWRC